MPAAPYYLRPQDTHLPEGHDETLDPPEPPTDAARRSVPPTRWPRRNLAPGPNGPRDRPAGVAPTDPARRSLPAFDWPRLPWLGALPQPDLDPDIALWPQVLVNRWPFSGPPTTGVWPKGWFGVDTDAVVWICTVGGAPGTWAPIAGPSTFVTPEDYGAVGDGVHDDTAAVQAAIAATSSGGLIRFPNKYAVSAALNYYPGQTWQGNGRNVSAIHLTRDLWTSGVPVPFLTPAGGITNYNNASIRDLHIAGPGFFQPPYGSSLHVHTNGLRSAGGCVYSNLFITGFFAGVENIQDHETYYNVFAVQNYYGISFSDAARFNNGNQAFYSCNFTGNSLASIHLSNAAAILSATFVQTHVGWGPIAILRTDTQSQLTPWDGNDNPVYAWDWTTPPAVNVGIQKSVFDGIDFEQIGNVGYLDASSQGGGGGNFSFTDSYMDGVLFIWNTTTFNSVLPPFCNVVANQGAWAFSIRGGDSAARIRLTSFPVGSWGGITCAVGGTTGPTIEVAAGGIPAALLGSYDGVNSYTSGGYRGLVLEMGGTGGMGEPLIGEYTVNGKNGTGEIDAGDLVECATTGYALVQRATGGSPIYGVARTTSVVGATVPVLVAYKGQVRVNTTTAGPTTPGNRTYYQSATAGSRYLADTVSTTGRPIGCQWVQNDTTGIWVNMLLRLQPT